MGCCDADSVQVSKMALEIKSGPMLWYKRRFFGSNWRDVHSVLYNDSSFFWYKDKSRQDTEGSIVLKNAPELIAFGTYTSQVPDRPDIPDHYEPKELLAFGVRGKDVVYWFLCPNEEEVASWMNAIASTLPPPPSYSQMPQTPSAPSEISPPQMPPPPPPAGHPNLNHGQMPAPQYQPQQPQYAPNQQQVPHYAPRHPGGVPGQYPPPTNYRPPPYQPHNTVHPLPQPYASYPASSGGGGPTTVIVQDRPGYVTGGGGGDFATGMLLGGVLGTAWGSHHHSSFGGGGWGGGWGHGHSVQDTNVHINNYYDNDTTTVNNNMDMTNNMSIEQAAQYPVPGAAVAAGSTAGAAVAAGSTAETAVEPAAEYAPVEPLTEYAPVEPVAEYLPVEEVTEYIPVEDPGGQMYDGGDYGGDFCDGDFGGGDFGGGDFGGDDFGGGDFGAF